LAGLDGEVGRQAAGEVVELRHGSLAQEKESVLERHVWVENEGEEGGTGLSVFLGPVCHRLEVRTDNHAKMLDEATANRNAESVG